MPPPVLETQDLRVALGGVTVLHGVSFAVEAGETLGLVGESGSGKSTLARAVMRLIPLAGGKVRFCGEDFQALAGANLRRRRRGLQMVFQDPLASLNPRMPVGRALAEPLEIHEPTLSPPQRAARVAEMFERVGLPAGMLGCLPREFSGGQCQRIAIARAMMLRPLLLICDEPVSSLDVSVQGQIVNLLTDLQQEFGTALLFISHNLAVVRHLCRRVIVMYQGRLVELADCDALFAAPLHPYTRALLAAIPDPFGGNAGAATLPAGSPATEGRGPADGAGCAYRHRCPLGTAVCDAGAPTLAEAAAGHLVACHRWREVVYS